MRSSTCASCFLRQWSVRPRSSLLAALSSLPSPGKCVPAGSPQAGPSSRLGCKAAMLCAAQRWPGPAAAWHPRSGPVFRGRLGRWSSRLAPPPRLRLRRSRQLPVQTCLPQAGCSAGLVEIRCLSVLLIGARTAARGAERQPAWRACSRGGGASGGVVPASAGAAHRAMGQTIPQNCLLSTLDRPKSPIVRRGRTPFSVRSFLPAHLEKIGSLSQGRKCKYKVS